MQVLTDSDSAVAPAGPLVDEANASSLQAEPLRHVGDIIKLMVTPSSVKRLPDVFQTLPLGSSLAANQGQTIQQDPEVAQVQFNFSGASSTAESMQNPEQPPAVLGCPRGSEVAARNGGEEVSGEEDVHFRSTSDLVAWGTAPADNPANSSFSGAGLAAGSGVDEHGISQTTAGWDCIPGLAQLGPREAELRDSEGSQSLSRASSGIASEILEVESDSDNYLPAYLRQPSFVAAAAAAPEPAAGSLDALIPAVDSPVEAKVAPGTVPAAPAGAGSDPGGHDAEPSARAQAEDRLAVNWDCGLSEPQLMSPPTNSAAGLPEPGRAQRSREGVIWFGDIEVEIEPDSQSPEGPVLSSGEIRLPAAEGALNGLAEFQQNVPGAAMQTAGQLVLGGSPSEPDLLSTESYSWSSHGMHDAQTQRSAA